MLFTFVHPVVVTGFCVPTVTSAFRGLLPMFKSRWYNIRHLPISRLQCNNTSPRNRPIINQREDRVSRTRPACSSLWLVISSVRLISASGGLHFRIWRLVPPLFRSVKPVSAAQAVISLVCINPKPKQVSRLSPKVINAAAKTIKTHRLTRGSLENESLQTSRSETNH